MRRKNEPIDVFMCIDIPPQGDEKPCWLWADKLNPTDGRPYFTIGGVKHLAYRVVYELTYGPLQPGEIVRHKVCDNPACCNPHHLLKGTQSDNETDKYEAERWGFPHAVIDDIRRMSEKGMQQKHIAIAVTYIHGIKVTQQRVSDIITGARRAKA